MQQLQQQLMKQQQVNYKLERELRSLYTEKKKAEDALAMSLMIRDQQRTDLDKLRHTLLQFEQQKQAEIQKQQSDIARLKASAPKNPVDVIKAELELTKKQLAETQKELNETSANLAKAFLERGFIETEKRQFAIAISNLQKKIATDSSDELGRKKPRIL